MKYQVILFDLDGTLTDPKIGITKSVQYALRKCNIIEPDLDRLIPFIGPPLTESFQEFYSLSPAAAQAAVGYYREYFVQAGMYENAVYPGVETMLTRLAATGRDLIIATSKPTVFSEQIIAHFGLGHFFKAIVGSHLDGSRIHKAEVIACILSQLPQVEPADVIMIGDRKHDISGARSNGLAAIGVSYGYGGPAELRQAGADYLVASVTELEQLLLSL
ncbi:5'-nucleotidase [Sporomusa termitida]|uniref:5'-nucleotidase n=1 Tax=Sporomusa termitida TaxID=2377 RepID=A0A517DYL3_9FIRM|nr:5'-nucleotidase [Sporomusa termitida]